eukprot:CAMPEP_0179032878 /NCGR_PEP_ID=MMETSP0796-20121207/11816_1 /TAXON_ID=73915 /ORGANISM="Pyrodinium bahamense, Strain pbaha01" /LENGTH=275 /DNA_ID=CAMNT_0020729121 /DNA_START=17 /DNA_END=844 /DNA_ORIENTATION=+
MGNMPMVALGCTLVYPGSRFDPLLTLRALAERRCTSLLGVPTMFIAILDHPEFPKYKFEAMRTGAMGGALCPVDTMNRVISEMGAREVTVCFGMTELSGTAWQTRIGTPIELTCSTVGQIHPHLECKVVDPQTFEVLPFDTPGELWIVFGRITGRIKDMIIRGGENIFPKEVEEPLISHPDVSNASVIGVPDRRLGEQVCAWIAWKGGAPSGDKAVEAEQQIRAFLKDKVAYFKVPKYIVFKDEFPLTTSGKVRKAEMREISTRELGLGQLQSRL